MSKTISIEKKIVSYAVKKADAQTAQALPAAKDTFAPALMNENIGRPDVLTGTTYKIKPAVSEHAMYITINDITLNEGTEHEARLPYEIFINSKSMEHFQWVIALTRVVSAVFRKGGDISFLIEELLSVYDPNGGYYKKGGVFMPSLVADIGGVIKTHLVKLGLIKADEMSDEQRRYIEDKRVALLATEKDAGNSSGFPASAIMCGKCSQKAVVTLEGCRVCLGCGDSKCSG